MELVGEDFFFQAEDGIRDAQEARGLGDVYERQGDRPSQTAHLTLSPTRINGPRLEFQTDKGCLLYPSDAADDLLRVDPGGRRIIKQKNNHHPTAYLTVPRT